MDALTFRIKIKLRVIRTLADLFVNIYLDASNRTNHPRCNNDLQVFSMSFIVTDTVLSA
jgi:hypothetical protein